MRLWCTLYRIQFSFEQNIQFWHWFWRKCLCIKYLLVKFGQAVISYVLIFRIKIYQKKKKKANKMELYSVNHHLISYSEIFTSLSHWSSNLEFCSTTFYCKLLQVLVPWKSHVPLLFFKLAYREVGMIFSSGPGQAYLCSWKAHSQSLDCTFLAGGLGVEGWGARIDYLSKPYHHKNRTLRFIFHII